MIAFTDSNGGYYQHDGDNTPLWAIGMTPTPVVPVIPPDPKDAIRAEIKRMEDYENLPRGTREFMLLYMESSFTAPQLALNIGYTNMKAFDSAIIALRNQL